MHTLQPGKEGTVINSPTHGKQGNTIHREGKLDAKQAKQTTEVQYIVEFLSFLFVIQTFLYFLNQWNLINKMRVLESKCG